MSEFCQHHKFEESIKHDIQPLLLLDNYHGILAVLTNYLILSAVIYLTIKSYYILYPLSILIIGSRQRALATMLHESSHHTLAANRKLSFILGTIFSGYLIFSTYSAYKHTHVRLHHGQFGNSEQDDDYKYMLSRHVYEKTSPENYIKRFFLIPLLSISSPKHILFLMKSRLFVKNKNNRYEMTVLCFYWLLFFIVAIKLDILLQLILFWIIPYFTTFQLINWFIELSEHAPLMKNGIDIEMSRNRNSHWLEHMLTGMHNENYHLAHHLWPIVPFWNIKKLHHVLIRDTKYAKLNNQFGGIFLSSNRAAPLIIALKKYIVEN